MPTKIILTRHGHVEGIEPRRFRGPYRCSAYVSRGRAGKTDGDEDFQHLAASGRLHKSDVALRFDPSPK
jgi:hypothetical protein